MSTTEVTKGSNSETFEFKQVYSLAKFLHIQQPSVNFAHI